MVGQDLFWHDVGRIQPGDGREVGGHRAPGIGITLVGVSAETKDTARQDVPAGHPDSATHRPEDGLEIGHQGTVAIHQHTQVAVVAGLPGGEEPAHLSHLLEVELAHTKRGLGVEVGEPGANLLEPGHVPVDVVLIVPAFVQDDRDHGAIEERVGSGSDGEVDIGELGGFRSPRIDDHQQPIGILGHLLQEGTGPLKVVAHHGVLSHDEQHVRFLFVRGRVNRLAAEGSSIRPETAGQLLRDGVVHILRAELIQERERIPHLHRASQRTPTHQSQGAGTVSVKDRLQLLRDLVQRLIPRNPFEGIAHLLHRVQESVRVVLIVGDGLALATDVALAARVLLVRPDLDHPVVFHLHFEPAKVSTQDTSGLLLLCHVSSHDHPDGFNQ